MNQWIAGMGLIAYAALPVMAQEGVPGADAPGTVESPGADAVQADPADVPEPETAAEGILDEPSADPAPTEPVSATGSDEGADLNLYLGLEYDLSTIDFEEGELRESFNGTRFDSEFYKLRLGVRLFESVGVELQAGIPASDSGEDELETRQFYGLYLVPTAVALEVIEVSARVGYAFISLENDTGDEDFDGISFGVAAELPLRVFGEGLPNFRIGLGATVYQVEREARVFGFHGGLRYDFSI